jgi:hypothetical protein
MASNFKNTLDKAKKAAARGRRTLYPIPKERLAKIRASIELRPQPPEIHLSEEDKVAFARKCLLFELNRQKLLLLKKYSKKSLIMKLKWPPSRLGLWRRGFPKEWRAIYKYAVQNREKWILQGLDLGHVEPPRPEPQLRPPDRIGQ